MPAAIDELYVLRLCRRIRAPVDAVLFAIIVEPSGLLAPSAFDFVALTQPGRPDNNPLKLPVSVITPVDDFVRRVLHEKAARSAECVLLRSARDMHGCARKVHDDVAFARHQGFDELAPEKLG